MAESLMMEYIDGKLPDEDLLIAHLSGCAECTEAFKAYKEIVSHLEDDVLLEAPDGFEESVMKKINESIRLEAVSNETEALGAGNSLDFASALALGIFSILIGISISVSMFGGEITGFLSRYPALLNAYINALALFADIRIMLNDRFISGLVGRAAVIIEQVKYPMLALVIFLIAMQVLIYRSKKLKIES
jgi:hypothetical protein